jgi:hypothetical protein
MFQRVQSVFLAAALLLVAASFFIPFGTFTDGINPVDLRSYGPKTAGGEYLTSPSSYYVYIVFTLVIAANAAALFLYKNRTLQLRLLKFTFLLFALAFVLLSLYINDGWGAFPGRSFQPGISLFLPIGGIFFNYMAARGVKKDDELVRSVDRIR